MEYTLMHKHSPVLSIEVDETRGEIIAAGELLSPRHVPVGVPCHPDRAELAQLNEWWMSRVIRTSRPGLPAVLDRLGLQSPQQLRSMCYGLSLTDHYWCCPAGTSLRWEDINFFTNAYAADMGCLLFGEAPQGQPLDLSSPDNTTDGWLRKRWVVQDGKRVLQKGGSTDGHEQEPYNELLATALMRRLGVPHAPYTLTCINGYPFSVCENIVCAGTEMVSAEWIMNTRPRKNGVPLLEHFLGCCQALGIPGMQKSMDQMITVDFIIANEDRHAKNFSALRSADTLEWLGAAPIYDNGSALWYEQPTEEIVPGEDRPAKPFANTHAQQLRLVSSFDWLDLSALQGLEDELREILRSSPFIDDTRRDALCAGLRARVDAVQEAAAQAVRRAF